MSKESLSPEIRALQDEIQALHGFIKAHGVELAKLKRDEPTGAEDTEDISSQVSSSRRAIEWAKGAWCVTGLKSGATIHSTDTTLWDAAFDNPANSSYRIFKGSLTRYGELNPHYDGDDIHTRHRLLFVNKGAPFQTKLHIRAFTGSISSSSLSVLIKMNGQNTVITADGDVTITVRQGVNNLAIIHRSGRTVDVWAQFLDGANVYGLDVNCGKIAGTQTTTGGEVATSLPGGGTPGELGGGGIGIP